MKHRESLYMVVRRLHHSDVVVGIYRTSERADEIAASFKQQWLDKFGEHRDNPDFIVTIGTYYDE